MSKDSVGPPTPRTDSPRPAAIQSDDGWGRPRNGEASSRLYKTKGSWVFSRRILGTDVPVGDKAQGQAQAVAKNGGQAASKSGDEAEDEVGRVRKHRKVDYAADRSQEMKSFLERRGCQKNFLPRPPGPGRSPYDSSSSSDSSPSSTPAKEERKDESEYLTWTIDRKGVREGEGQLKGEG